MKQLDRRQGHQAVIRALRGVILDSRNLVPSTPLPAPPNYGVRKRNGGQIQMVAGACNAPNLLVLPFAGVFNSSCAKPVFRFEARWSPCSSFRGAPQSAAEFRQGAVSDSGTAATLRRR